MSWRRFLTLCKNLSPHGAVAVSVRAMQDKRDAKDDRDETDEERDRRAADALFTSVVSV